jgi:hypothetical protein
MHLPYQKCEQYHFKRRGKKRREARSGLQENFPEGWEGGHIYK